MHLIAPLAAGVAGAENGIAEIFERGTVNRVQWYHDFEAQGTSALDVALDSHGGAVVYVGELCSVVVKTAGGAILREFVAGVREDCVEVESPAFSGATYDGATSGPGRPTTLAAVLDRWQDINGGTDWQVDIPGQGIYPIGAAIAGSFGLVYNVKQFGALGNGVGNDTNAINGAIGAANASGGGIVYFPPGTYRTTGGHTVPGNVSLIGAGNTATSLVLDNLAASRLLLLAVGPSADRYNIIANMRMASAALATGALMIDCNSAVRTVFDCLYLDGTNFGSHIVSAQQSSNTDVIFTACVFQLGQSGRAFGLTSAGLSRRAAFRDCRFITPVTFTPSSVLIGNFLDLTSCMFDNAATVTGTYSCVFQNTSAINWNITGCQFSNAAGATVTALDITGYSSSANIVESDNVFGTTVTAYAYSIGGVTAKGANVHLKSRELRVLYLTDGTTTPSLPIDQYGIIIVTSTTASAIVFNVSGSRPPDGARGTIIVVRTAAAPGTVTAGVNFMNPAAISTVQNGTYLWEYRVCVPVAAFRMALIVDGRNNGNVP